MITLITGIILFTIAISFFVIDYRLRRIENTLIDLDVERERMRHDIAKEFDRLEKEGN
jgi:adenylosuccinate lyase